MSPNPKIIRGHYRIEKILGRGGFGITYLAVDIHLPSHPKFVVKQLSPQKDDPDTLLFARERFKKEAKVLERLGEQHDQIPKLLAYFEEKKEFYLIQEFVDGHDLRHEISSGKHLSENEVISLLQDILKVLEFVHQQKVIHRDIKPSNLIRRYSDNKIVLIDFGAIKEISTSEVSAEKELCITCNIGTPGYKPTEQEQGYPKLCSDIYAVGMLGIQALTGLHPCSLEKDYSGDFIWRKHAPQVSNAFAYVLDRMVRQDFQFRYKSATEALIALNVANKTTLAEPIQLKSTQNTTHDEPLPAPLKGFRKNRVSNLSINLAGYPFIIVLLLLLTIPSFYIFQIIQRKDLEEKYQSYETKIDMNDVCQQKFIYEETDELKNKVPIEIRGAKYDEELKGVWPVFRWVCLYQPIKRENKKSFQIREDKRIGMDLDKYCEKKYPDDKTKASHHDYNDPNSLYCTRPKP